MLDIIYGPDDVNISVYFIVSIPEEAISEEEYEATAKDLFSDAIDEEWTLVDEFNGEYINENIFIMKNINKSLLMKMVMS